MNGKVSKRLRKYIYGDLSLKDRKYITLPNGQVISDKNRFAYQKVKNHYNHNEWKGWHDYERN